MGGVRLSAARELRAEPRLLARGLSRTLSSDGDFFESVDLGNKVSNLILKMSTVHTPNHNQFCLFLIRPGHSLPIPTAIRGHECRLANARTASPYLAAVCDVDSALTVGHECSPHPAVKAPYRRIDLTRYRESPKFCRVLCAEAAP